MIKKSRVAFTLALLCCSGLALQAPTNAAPADKTIYKETNLFHVGGEGGWDYLLVDSAHKLLYVPRVTHTMVLDAVSGKTVADIPGQKGNHGTAIVPELGRGFISDGKDASVTVFDLNTYAVLGKVPAAEDADGIIYDPASRKVFVSCGDANSLVVLSPDVDPKTGKADTTVPLGGKPEFLAADGRGRLYVNLEDKDLVAVVDTKTMTVSAKWPVAPGGAPVGMSMDTQKRRLFVGCRKPQKLIVMNADDGKLLAELPIGAGVDATAFDDGNVLASCRDGSLSVIRETSENTFEVVQTVKTRPGARTMGVDLATHQVFLPTAEFGTQVSAQGRPVPKPDSFMVLVLGRS